jgi:hypothetical protein
MSPAFIFSSSWITLVFVFGLMVCASRKRGVSQSRLSVLSSVAGFLACADLHLSLQNREVDLVAGYSVSQWVQFFIICVR